LAKKQFWPKKTVLAKKKLAQKQILLKSYTNWDIKQSNLAKKMAKESNSCRSLAVKRQILGKNAKKVFEGEILAANLTIHFMAPRHSA
jgi:hypothetical protein